MIDLKNINIKRAHQSLMAGEYTVRELVDAYLKNIEEKNSDLNIYLSLFSELIDTQTQEAQKRFEEGKATLLTGIPVALKANIAFKGQNMNSGSNILKNYIAPYDATVVEKLKKENVVFLGYLNMDEFACGGSTETSAFGITKNPLDTSRVPGGSSGGSAAAVAANMSMVALGTDTGGSIRQPASFCGVIGVKPTYGRVSRKGVSAMGSSLDQISPITKNLEDNKIVLDVMADKDEYDMTSLEKGNFLEKEIKMVKKVAVPRNFINQIKNEKVLDNFNQALSKLEKEGYEIVDIDLDILKYTLPVYYIIMPSELSSNLARLDGMRYGNKIEGENMIDDYFKTRGAGFGEEVKRRIILGTYALSAGYDDQYYNKAGALREKIKKEFSEKIKNFDAILMPTTPDIAFELGKNIRDPLSMYLSDIFTVSSNIIGNPAISIPSGEIETNKGNKMPLGLQILSDFEDEAKMYKIAEDFIK